MTAKSAPYPSFPANDKLQPDLGILLWPELRRVTQPPFIAGPLCLSVTILQNNDNIDIDRLSITVYQYFKISFWFLWNNFCSTKIIMIRKKT